MEDFDLHQHEKVKAIILGNKKDLLNDRVISSNDGLEFAKSHLCLF